MLRKSLAALLSLLVLATFFPYLGTDAAVDVGSIRYSENFDSVTAPDFPDGWSVTSTGTGSTFAITTDLADSAPNSVHSVSPPTTGSTTLTSPSMLVTGANSVLGFKQKYAMETTYDGGVLEISVAGGEWHDIVDAGGVFLSGGYTHDLNFSTNPLSGRRAWSGATQVGFASSSLRLPKSTFGQYVRFRWILGTNASFGNDGWWIDSVTLEAIPAGSDQTPITIGGSGPASPYPAPINVAGISGFVTGVSVNLGGLTHASPDDLDILLVAPNGRAVILMSDAGGTNPVSGADLTFNDSAPATLPDSAAVQRGFFKPSDFEPGDPFPAPAPQNAPSNSLGSLVGTNPNGIWRLFIVDDAGSNAGTIDSGWSLDILFSPNACLFNLAPTAQSFPASGGDGAFQVDIPAGCAWTASSLSSYVSLTSTGTGEGTGSITYAIGANSLGARTGLISVTDGITTKTFQAQQASGCPTSISESALTVGAIGGNIGVAVTASAGCIWHASTGSTWINVTSGPQSGNGIAQLTVAPNPARTSRTATVTIGAQTLRISQSGAQPAKFDFDGDGRSDISVFRDGTWHLLRSNDGYLSMQFGIATDRLVPADYDADGRTDMAVFRGGVWYVLRSSDSAVSILNFGLAGDVPVPADYDGDGLAEPSVFRDGIWYRYNLTNSETSQEQFGLAGDRAVVSDYDGDGHADLAVYRNGIWYLQRSLLGFAAIQFGIDTDLPVPGDFDGDGRADLGVYRDGDWHVLVGFQNYSVIHFGLAGDVPVAGDYDGDGRTDRAVFRAGTWFLDRSSEGFAATEFGTASDFPVPAAFSP